MGRRGIHNEGSQTLNGPAGRQDNNRFRHGAPAVHAGVRAALAWLILAARWSDHDEPAAAGPGQCAVLGSVHVRHECPFAPPWRSCWRKRYLPVRHLHRLRRREARANATRFVDVVLEEVGLDLGRRQPQTLDDLEDDYFDLIITLAPEAHHQALETTRANAVDVVYWPTPDPAVATGSRERILSAYRDVRDHIEMMLKKRFGKPKA